MMYPLLVVLIAASIEWLIVAVNGQGLNADGSVYFCAPPGVCDAVPGGGGTGIDPRIITPGQVTCPAGLVPCFSQGPQSRCGRRLNGLAATPNADGVATAGAYPWQAFFRNATHPFAGSGVLLGPYHILTAAHKVRMYVAAPAALTVIMGVFSPLNLANTQSSVASAVYLNPAFNVTGDTLKDDIAIVRLATPIRLAGATTINSACLPTGTQSFIGQTCVVSGWGQQSPSTNDAPTNPMKQVNVRIVTNAVCAQGFTSYTMVDPVKYLDPVKEICAGGEGNKDACFQDGGSPLVCYDAAAQRYTIAGLVIWGKSCGVPGVYGVYVNVPSYMTDFIVPRLTTP